ncbi:iron-containing alcohol dehydrogenase [Ectobacillus antri]|jgi:alcohol dehydrogenase YqhD (iron-dependent ADH family)|uniref:Iron-containing alcohol dehydrogenase n=1 Tax=Ectobacillus antri TaxID=2486280 RepID=A0ABT6H5C8_9BACI|nr:iron-containing alcohol dehydrogenase [Ectobacillus antri]MDG4657337.1 iron-containing alcohol dehydrogenase [Ectobacillus antri]MDG5754532.1 iron-containing alcohol dehydrogenase [Ectobacillus antri]
MENFRFHNPTKLIFGKGQLEALKTEVPLYGKRVLLLYGGGSIKRSGLYDQVQTLLAEADLFVVELGGVEPNPRVSTVNKGISLIKEHNLDFILAVGGGSVIDCAKAIAAGSHYDGDVWDIVTKKVVPTSAVPIGTVLTLAATGSEMNGGSVITNWEQNDKRSFGSIYTYPKFSILDPQLTFTVPRDQTIYGIVDIMSHVLEQYFHASENAQLQERIGESILRTVMEVAPKLVNDLENYAYREAIMLNGTFALNGILSMGVKTDWATHMMEHAVSAVYDIPHGGGLAILFPHWMEYVAATKPEKVAQLGVRVFDLHTEGKTEAELAAETVAALRAFWTSIDAPQKLADYNINDEQLDLMAERAMVAPTIGNYVPLTKEDVREILKRAL